VSGPLVSKAELGREQPIRSMVASDAYRNACDRMGWKPKPRRFCAECGRPAAWCDCSDARNRNESKR
jgi:hypothetical protein